MLRADEVGVQHNVFVVRDSEIHKLTRAADANAMQDVKTTLGHVTTEPAVAVADEELVEVELASAERRGLYAPLVQAPRVTGRRGSPQVWVAVMDCEPQWLQERLEPCIQQLQDLGRVAFVQQQRPGNGPAEGLPLGLVQQSMPPALRRSSSCPAAASGDENDGRALLDGVHAVRRNLEGQVWGLNFLAVAEHVPQAQPQVVVDRLSPFEERDCEPPAAAHSVLRAQDEAFARSQELWQLRHGIEELDRQLHRLQAQNLLPALRADAPDEHLRGLMEKRRELEQKLEELEPWPAP